MMVAEAGPRVWHDDDLEGAGSKEQYAPETVEGTVLVNLAHDLPAVPPNLLESWTEVPPCPERPTTLLIARSRHGRVAVARADAAVATVVELADGRTTLEDLAREAGLRPAELEATLAGLTELGAVRVRTGGRRPRWRPPPRTGSSKLPW